MKQITFCLFLLLLIFSACSSDDENTIHDIGSLEGYLRENTPSKIIYNDYRNTVWILVSTISSDPSKGFLCGPRAFDYHLVRVEGDSFEVKEDVQMIVDWTICQKHNLWVLSENKVKQIIDMDKPFSVFTEEEGFYLSSLLADSEGNLWAGGNNGVLKMDENLNWTRYTPETSVVPSLNTRNMAIGADDTKWVSFDDGNLSLLRINDDIWDQFICENDGPYCQSSNFLGVNESGDLLMTFTNAESASITVFNGGQYEDNVLIDNEGNNIVGRVQKLQIYEGNYYALVYNLQTSSSFLYKRINDQWTELHESNYINDFAVVENEIWLLDAEEGLVKTNR